MKPLTAFTVRVTLEDILVRCVEDGDCRVWKGAYSHDKRPLWHVQASRSALPVRRLVLEIRLRRRVAAGRYAGCSCSTVGCVIHAKEMTRPQLMAAAKEAGSIGGPAASARARIIGQRNAAKLSMQAAEEIRLKRAGGATLTALADEYGVHFSMIDRVCKLQAWAPVVGSSVFAWRGA